ncbi:hypothetical protein QO010_000601 [Caulobacter ginsengisoli]|uniref:DUF2155 domain-containing protein n=1 Tax=Caulobacter ginsengisoli TaxID=400775 RepID=A0ABU0INU8_9CAUL|nr:DUF2155 domain-containing protein [Caulobacter ginsengisoli]MDQ0462853.1 hypothetical protein [Caulobacter ginsengisoli]
MRRRYQLVLTLVATLAAGSAVLAQNTPPAPAPESPAPTPAPVTPSAPAPEEAPPAPPAAPTPKVEVAPTETEKPAVIDKKKPAAAKPAEPQKRARSPAAILQALDKVTAETFRFEAPVGQPIRYKTLVINVKACETTASDELIADSSAYVEIVSQPKAQPGRLPPQAKGVFKGWMFASSPAINPVKHPVYDVWLISCKTAGPAPSPAKR